QRGRGRCCSSCDRDASTSGPYCTPEGQTASHARQLRHWYICSSNSESSKLNRPSATAFIIHNRPRGDDASCPVSRYVGQLGRHMPQWTQSRNRSSSGTSCPENGTGFWSSSTSDIAMDVPTPTRQVARD